MTEGSTKTPSLKEEKGQDTSKNILWIFVGVAVLWAGCTLAIYLLLPDWQTRGTAGDSFGAVNALFSGLAFAGVLYSLNLQRGELVSQRQESAAARALTEAQLAEMRAARELAAQPLPIPRQCTFEIEQPRLFYYPPGKKHSVQARYFAYTPLGNPTQFPALSVNVSAYLHFGEPRIVLSATDEYVSIVAPDNVAEESPPVPDFMFNDDTQGALFDQLRQSDPRIVPNVAVVVLFKNALGAHFRIVQSFRLYANDEDDEILRSWHTAVAGFAAKYKRELSQMIELRRNGRLPEWDELFDHVKVEFAASVDGPARLELRMMPIPASFSLEHIPADEFSDGMRQASYAQLISDLYDCPSELDSRSDIAQTKSNNQDQPQGTHVAR